MRAICRSFLHMLKLIQYDMMLFAAGVVPFLAGIAIHFGVPLLEIELIRFTGLPSVLSPYYGLFDIIFTSITPVLFCFIAAMILLEERDDHIDCYLYVTGIGQNGYFISRIVIPALAAFIVTVAFCPSFRLTALSAEAILFLSLAGALQGIIIALLIVTLSSNKLEGMAITKLSTLMIFGAAAPYFIPAPLSFCFSFLPSFWMGKAMSENNLMYVLPSILVAGVCILVLYRNSKL